MNNNSSVLLVVVHSSDPDGPLPGVFVFPAGERICIEVPPHFQEQMTPYSSVSSMTWRSAARDCQPSAPLREFARFLFSRTFAHHQAVQSLNGGVPERITAVICVSVCSKYLVLVLVLAEQTRAKHPQPNNKRGAGKAIWLLSFESRQTGRTEPRNAPHAHPNRHHRRLASSSVEDPPRDSSPRTHKRIYFFHALGKHCCRIHIGDSLRIWC